MRNVRKLALIVLVALVAAPALKAQETRIVVLVRHAEAGGEPQGDPPLTEVGQDRAQALARVLERAAIGTIVVSGLQRTQFTAAPVAAARGIEPIVVETSGGLGAHVAAVAAAVRAAPAGHAVLVAGHSNTIPAIIHALGGPAMDELCHGEFRRLFVMELGAAGSARLITADYGPPDEGC